MRHSAYVMLATLGLVLFASNAVAAETAAFDLVGVGSGSVLAGVYTSPYTGTINGGPPVSVICDDFSDETYNPEDWTANVTQLSTVTPTSPTGILQWSGGVTAAAFTIPGGSTYSWNLNQAQAYTVAAVLATEILTSASGSTEQKDLSFALWELFDPKGTTSPLDPGVVPWLEGTTSLQTTPYLSDLTAASNDVSLAITAAAGLTPASFPNVTIYSYAGGGVTGCGGCAPPPQEFITVSMAEPPSLTVLAVYLLLGGGSLLFFGRRRIFGTTQI